MDDYVKQAEAYLAEHPEFGTALVGELGSGYNGQVWETDRKLVLKVTRDAEEYQTTSRIMRSANGKYTPRYDACQPIGSGLYVLFMEKVSPVKLSATQSQLLNIFRDRLLDMIGAGDSVDALLPGIRKLPDPLMARLLTGLAVALQGLHRLGIDHADVQEDNLGWRGDQLVLLDVVHEGLLAESLVGAIRRQLHTTLRLLRKHLG